LKVRTLFHRSAEIQKIRRDLERDSFPRLQMFLLVAITGTAGFVASSLLLSNGLLEIWLRYLASFGVAYLVFLTLLWLWLRTRGEDWNDFPNISDVGSPSGSHSTGGSFTGNGGDFGGGGASGSFDAPADIHNGAVDVVGDALGSAAEAEEFAIPLVVLIFIGVLFVSSFFMIYSAPVLFAELLVDGVLSASLYRKLRGLETRHWLETAIRRTFWPFAMTAIMVSATGWAMSRYAPEAHTLGEVILHAKHKNKVPN